MKARVFTECCRCSLKSLGKGSIIVPPARIFGESRIEIGPEVFVGADSWLQALGENSSGTAIRIGSGTSLAGDCTISAAFSVTIEERVLIARYAYIADHRHEFKDCRRAILDQGICSIAPVLVRTGAWIGQNCVICPGVTIGRGAVVGANSVVRTDIPDFCVAAGAPAKVIRRISDQK